MAAYTTVGRNDGFQSEVFQAGCSLKCLAGGNIPGQGPPGQAAVQPTHQLRRSLFGVGGGMAGAFPHPSNSLPATKPVETVSASPKLGQCSGVRPQGGF